MPDARSVICAACGAKNTLPLAHDRCTSCGATVGRADRSESRQQEVQRQFHQAGFSVAWFGISLVVIGVLTGAVLFGVPMVIPALDFEGSAGSMVSIAVWFGGGLLVGLVSPGRTFVEPAVATAVVAVPTVFLLVQGQTVKTWPAFLYVMMGVLGVVFALVGAYAGERLQFAEPAHE